MSGKHSMTTAALAAVIRRHVHGPNLGFWCVSGSEDLPGVLAEALTAAGCVLPVVDGQADAALALLARVDVAGVE